MKWWAALIVFCLTPAMAGLLGAPPAAQPTATQNVRGQIIAADASSVTVKTTAAGSPVRLALAPAVSVTSLTKGSLSDVNEGTYIGMATVQMGTVTRWPYEPTLRALELHIFPESMKGEGDGQRKWDLTPDSKMTHGTVFDVQTRGLSIRFNGLERVVQVSNKIPVVKVGPGDRALLTPGANIFAVVQKGTDGTLTALRISVGMDGLVPPM